MQLTPQQIGVAVVVHDGRYLVGTRREDGPLPGYAEFPGGKCEPGEAPADCAVRECREETGLSVVAVEQLVRCRYSYPHSLVDLHFWLCRPADDREVTPSHSGFRWVPPSRLAEMRFPEANRPVLEMLCPAGD